MAEQADEQAADESEVEGEGAEHEQTGNEENSEYTGDE